MLRKEVQQYIRLIKRHNTVLLRAKLESLMFRKKHSTEQHPQSRGTNGATAFC